MGTPRVPPQIQVSLDPRVLMCSKCKKISIRTGGALQCINGHIFCGELCSNRSQHCPVCDVDLKFGGVFVKCHPFMDTLMDKVTVYCPFVPLGCTASCMPKEKMADHKNECSFWREYEERNKTANPVCAANDEVMELSVDDSKPTRAIDSGHGDEGVSDADNLSNENEEEDIDEDNGSPGNGSEDETDNEMSNDNGKIGKKIIVEPPAKERRSTRSSNASSRGQSTSRSPGDFFTGGLKDRVFPKCDLCDKFFVNLASLRGHQRNIHGDLEKGTGKSCPICKEVYYNKFAVARHISTKHHQGKGKNTRDKRLFCRFCVKKFDKKQKLTAHILKDHQDKLD